MSGRVLEETLERIQSLERRMAVLEGKHIGRVERIYPPSLTDLSQISNDRLQMLWFFSENCGHCKIMIQDWNHLRENHPQYGWHGVNCKREGDTLSKQFGIRYFPTIVAVKGVKRKEYKGADRSHSALLKFAKTSDATI